MKTFALAVILAISLALPGAAVDSALRPDFSWANGAGVAVRAQLKQAEQEWNKAALVPLEPALLKTKSPCVRIDEHYLRELIHGSNFADASYCLLDAAMRREDNLDKSKTLYEKAAASAHPSKERIKVYRSACLSLRCSLRLAVGVSRAAISQAMASQDTSSYCFQAMESAIDALRDAAGYADQLGGKDNAESIRKLRSILFAIWEQAQKAKDVNLIKSIDLPKAFDEAFADQPQ